MLCLVLHSSREITASISEDMEVEPFDNVSGQRKHTPVEGREGASLK